MCACDISHIRMLIELGNTYLQSHFARKKEYETNYPPRALRFIRIFVILSNPLFNYLQFTDAWPGSESRDQHPFKAATSKADLSAVHGPEFRYRIKSCWYWI